MRKLLIGCGVVFGVFALLCLGGLGWLYRDPQIEIPTRTYPPDNVYPRYRALGIQMRQQLDKDTRFKQIEAAITSRQPIAAEDRAYYLRRIEPYLRAYAPLTTQPCKALFNYNIDEQFVELPAMRRLARAEMYLTREAIRRKQYAEALTRVQRVSRLADQVRNGGGLLHYLVGVALNVIAVSPVRETLPELNDRAALAQLLQLAREYEQRRVPLWQAMSEEQYFVLNAYRRVAAGEGLPRASSSSEQSQGVERLAALFGRPLVNLALPEFRRIMRDTIQELQKPFHQRNRKVFEQEPRQLLNGILLPVYARAPEREVAEVATMRMLGCVAAIRLHKMRTGSYPRSLQELQLGDMAIDPFSGEPFRYRVDPKRGFLLYSVGENRTDEGGATPYNGASEPRGDYAPTLVPVPDHLRGVDPDARPLASPAWLR